jgi:DNA-binding beta-propeller fold protein YncE
VSHRTWYCTLSVVAVIGAIPLGLSPLYAAESEPGTMPLYVLKTILDSPGCSSVDLSPDGTRIYSRINYGDWDGGYRVFDAATYAQLCDYRPGTSVDSAPWRGLVSSDNSSLYMTAYYAGAVKKLSVASCPIAETAAIPVGSWPAFMAFDSQRRFLYVCQGDPGTGVFGSLQVIDSNTDSVIQGAPLYGEPYGVSLSPGDEFVYVGSGTTVASRLYKIRTSDLVKVGTYVMLGNGLYKRPFSLSPDGGIAYVPDPSGNGVHVVDTLSMRQIAFWPLAGIHGFFASPDGTHAIVTGLASPLLRVLDLSQHEVVQTLDMGVNAEPHGAAYWVWGGTIRCVLLPVDTGVAVLEADVTPPEPPSAGPIAGPTGPARANTVVDVSSTFTDADSPDGHTASWNWGDGTESDGLVSETNGSGSVSGSHVYAVGGIYTIVLTVTDKDGGTGTAEYRDVIIYDPSGGFVTGGGWFDSPAGALLADPALSGKSNFGFNFKYKKGATQPSGQLEFQFKQGHLDFHSTSQDWLVVAGAKAQCMGSGMLKKGGDDCGFMLTAVDGELAADGVDRLRVQIWDKFTGDVIYDSGVVAGTLDLPAPIADGSIVVHNRAGDVNGDGYVNVVDLMDLAVSWGQTRGHAKYNAACDLNDDGDIDVVDLLTVVQDWGN